MEEPSCYAYTSTDAMVCSSKYYDGTSNAGRECYHTNDGITYKSTGYLTRGHTRGKMVKAPVYGKDSVLMVGGLNSGSGALEEYSDGKWNLRTVLLEDGLVGFRKGFNYVTQFHDSWSMSKAK